MNAIAAVIETSYQLFLTQNVKLGSFSLRVCIPEYCVQLNNFKALFIKKKRKKKEEFPHTITNLIPFPFSRGHKNWKFAMFRECSFVALVAFAAILGGGGGVCIVSCFLRAHTDACQKLYSYVTQNNTANANFEAVTHENKMLKH